MIARARVTAGLEWAFAIFTLYWLLGGLRAWAFEQPAGSLGADPDRMIVPVVYTLAVLLALVRWDRIRLAGPWVWWLVLPAVLAIASTAWSVLPGLSARSGVKIFGTTAVGLYLVTRFPPLRLLHLLATVLGIGIGVSLLVVVFAPSVGLMDGVHEGRWCGIFLHKNSFARVLSLALLVYLLLALESRGRSIARAAAIAGIAVSAVALVATGSRSAMVVVVAGVVVVAAASAFRRERRPSRRALILGAVVLATGLAWWRVDDLLDVMDRRRDLTRRTELWSELRVYVEARPVLGRGYDTFWRGADETPSSEVTQALMYYPSHAHNGFVDLTLELGVLGLLVVSIPLVLAGRRAAAAAVAGRSAVDLWPAVYIFYFVVSNLTESDLLQENRMYWAVYVATVAAMAQASRGSAPRGRERPRPARSEEPAG